jgi:hypothetical protein
MRFILFVVLAVYVVADMSLVFQRGLEMKNDVVFVLVAIPIILVLSLMGIKKWLSS